MAKVILKGKRILLRPPVRNDDESMFIHARDREVSRFTLLPRPYTIRNARTFIKECKKFWRNGKIHAFAIVWKESGRLIGMISIFRLDLKNRNAETGYWLGKKYWGEGITLEAVNLILRYGFKQLKLVRIYARVMHPNTASARVLMKAGFKKEGYFRKTTRQRGRWMDEIRFAILKDELK